MFERNDSTERFYVDADDASDESAKDGFRWLFTYMREHGHARATLVMPGVRNIGYLDRIIGSAAATELQKNRRLEIDGLTISVYTEGKLPPASDGPVLAMWTRDKSLEKLDVLDAPAICAVPWHDDNIAEWRGNWNPTNIRSGTDAGAQSTVTNPVVEIALEWLTTSVNVGTGIVNASDRATAIQTFTLLRDGGERFTADEVRAWAVRHGWAPADARELSELAQKILDRRRVRATDSAMFREDALEQWRQEAAGR